MFPVLGCSCSWLGLLMARQHPIVHARTLSACHRSPTQSPHPSPPHATRVTDLVLEVTRQVPEPGQRVLVLELSYEGEKEDVTFPPLHYKL